jgi:hypothetical protein
VRSASGFSRPERLSPETALDLLELQLVAVRLLDARDLPSELAAISRRSPRSSPGTPPRSAFGASGTSVLDIAEDRRLERSSPSARSDRTCGCGSGAVDRQAQHALADRADDLVEVVVAALRIVLLPEQHARPHAQEPGRDQAVVRPAVHLVAGDLLDQKSIVRLVLVERLDDVVAVPPCVRAMHVVLESRRVGVPATSSHSGRSARRSAAMQQPSTSCSHASGERSPTNASTWPASAAADQIEDRRDGRACGDRRAALT